MTKENKEKVLQKLENEAYKEAATLKTDSLLLTCLTLSGNKEVFLQVFNSINDANINKSFGDMEKAAIEVSKIVGVTEKEISKVFQDVKKVLKEDKESLLNIVKTKK